MIGNWLQALAFVLVFFAVVVAIELDRELQACAASDGFIEVLLHEG